MEDGDGWRWKRDPIEETPPPSSPPPLYLLCNQPQVHWVAQLGVAGGRWAGCCCWLVLVGRETQDISLITLLRPTSQRSQRNHSSFAGTVAFRGFIGPTELLRHAAVPWLSGLLVLAPHPSAPSLYLLPCGMRLRIRTIFAEADSVLVLAHFTLPTLAARRVHVVTIGRLCSGSLHSLV